MAPKRVTMLEMYRVALGGSAPWCPPRKRYPKAAAAATPAPDPAPAEPAEAEPAPDPPTAEPEAAPAPTPEAQVDPPPEAAANASAETQPTMGSDEFSEELDVTLLRLKGENKSWKDIAKELGKEQPAVKKRFGVLKSKEASEKTGKGKKGKEKQEDKDNDNPASEAGATSGIEVRYIDEDDDWSPEECLLLGKLHIQDGHETWARVASRFFDVTGRRVTAQEVQQKLSKR